MPDGKTLKENLAEEKQKLSGMNFKQKVSYFKTYYLTATLVVLALLIAGVWIMIESTLSRRDIEAAGVFINIEADNDCYQFLTTGYETYMDFNAWKSKVTLSTGDYIDFSPELQMMDSYQSQMALHAQISTGFFTYMIVDRNALEGLAYLDVYLDPQTIFTDKTKPIFQDAVVSLEMPVEGGTEGEYKEMPVALDLQKIGFATAASMNSDSAYLVFIDVDADYEKMKAFLDYFSTHPSITE